MTHGKKLGIGLGIGGALVAAAGAVLALVFGKKRDDVELIDCDEVTSDNDSTEPVDSEE